MSGHDRATVVMPCGSGKTLVALWIVERMGAKTVAVFAPTLGLLAQTAREFLANTQYPQPACLAICSDTSLVKGLDEIRPAPEDSPFAVTDKVAAVQSYLEKSGPSVKFLFCTYQSADVLGTALTRSGITLDFAFFDEAHRTAGKFGAPFSAILSNKNLPVHKRLFMTATLRSHHSTDSGLPQAHSMDNSIHYGEVCAKMSFAEAVGLGIICSYKVIVSVIDTASLRAEQLEAGLVKDQAVSARDAAVRESILQAMAQYDIKKVISYHSTIAQAENFATNVLEEAISGYETLHVSSELTGRQRHEAMEIFRNAERAVITNARCLTEGIDVPAVDMVVFADPKYSEIDIIQATGRAMRVSPNKTCGYIFLPLFLDQKGGESLAEGVTRNRYEAVWNVLNALCSMDSDFENQLSLYRQSLGLAEGMPGDLDKIEVMGQAGVDMKKIQKGVTIFLVRNMTDIWEEYYGELLRFRREHGNIAVPWATRLGRWLVSQRRHWDILTAEKQERLLELGFKLAPQEARWLEKLEELRAFKEQHGHIEVSSQSLRAWFKQQRKRWDLLSPEKREILLELGFDLDPIGTAWQKRIDELSAYVEVHGHCNVMRNENESLAQFLSGVRAAYQKGKLVPERIAALEKLGIVWGDQWARLVEDTIHKMRLYHLKHGELPPTNIRLKAERILIGRALILRRAYQAGRLTDEQIRRLKELSFSFEPDAERWRSRYNELAEYVASGGNPNRIPNNDPLRGWVRNIKKTYRKGSLTPERIELLEKIGLLWDDAGYMDTLWENYYQEVAEFFQKNAVSSLPASHSSYCWWKIQLRTIHKLPLEKAEKVRALQPLKRGKWSEQEKRILFENPDKSAEKLTQHYLWRTPQEIRRMRDKFGL